MTQHELDYQSPAVTQARADLALALRAAAHHGLSEGICNHFSVELADGSGRFLLNPQGLLWQEVQADDIVLIDVLGQRLAGRHPVESTAMHIHSAIHRLAGKAGRRIKQSRTAFDATALVEERPPLAFDARAHVAFAAGEALARAGASEGDTVRIGSVELEYVEGFS